MKTSPAILLHSSQNFVSEFSRRRLLVLRMSFILTAAENFRRRNARQIFRESLCLKQAIAEHVRIGINSLETVSSSRAQTKKRIPLQLCIVGQPGSIGSVETTSRTRRMMVKSKQYMTQLLRSGLSSDNYYSILNHRFLNV